jgi:PAS domain S-box-containing protein
MFWGQGFCLQDVNEGFLQMTGFAREEAIGKTWQEFTPQEFHEISQRAVVQVMTRGETTPFEKQYFRKDGSRFWGLFAPRRIGDEVVEFVLDVSERREAEAALRDASRRKDEFLATLAHELRNPLAPIRTGLQIMRMTRRPDEAEMQIIDVMDRQLAHLVRLVDDLLDLARISAGKVRMDRRVVSLREVLERSIEATQVQVQSRRHRLDVQLPPAEIHVDGDLDRLAQVFSNLLSNAAKYTPSAGHVRVDTKVDTAASPREVIVSIADNGVGIPADQQARVFEMFTQVRDHHTHFEGGLGIGLSLVQSLVRMHGGSVWLQSSAPGQGSTFCVKLPLADGSQLQAQEGAASGAQAQHAPIRILIADDNIDAAETLAMLLRTEGHDVAIAANGREAVEQTQLFEPDLALLDLGMPLMGGEEAARLIRAAPGGQDVRLVAVTGWGQPSDRDRTQQAGFDMHLVKPVTPEDIECALALVPNR